MPTASDILSPLFYERVERGVEVVVSTEKRVRVFTHHDADGISAGAVFGVAMERVGLEYHLSVLHSLERGFVEGLRHDGLAVFLDMGTGFADEIEAKVKRGDLFGAIILDHHRPGGDTGKVDGSGEKEGLGDVGDDGGAGGVDGFVHINSHMLGVDGTRDVSAATMAFLFALALDHENWDLAPVGLVGAMGDKQAMGGFTGLNHVIYENALKKGYLEEKWDLLLRTDVSLREALVFSADPFFRGLSGRLDRAEKVLVEWGFDPSITFADLSDEKKRALGGLLSLHMLESGVLPEVVETLLGNRFFVPSFGMYMDVLVDLANACGEGGKPGVGVAALMGSKWAVDEAREFEAEHRRFLVENLVALEDSFKSGQIGEMENIRFFQNDTPGIAGALAGVGIQYILPPDKPVFAVTPMEDRTRISSRANRPLVEEGVDLAEACRRAAAAVGGSGGGHPIAAGASIPPGKEEVFLREVDKIVGEQKKKNSTQSAENV